jgi:hypothetical protein
MVGSTMMTVISMLSRQAPQWQDDGAPKDSRIPACDGGVRGRNHDLGLSLGWKIRAQLGCFQWQWLLVCLMIRKARKGHQLFYTEGKEGSRVWEGGDTQEGLGRGGAYAFRVFFPPMLQAWPS